MVQEPILRALQLEDIPSAMCLKDAAGWNQTEEDWRLYLDRIPEGCFALEKDGRLIATSTAAAYGGGLGWVGMMLVHPEERRKGYGTRMLERAVAHLDMAGAKAGLDATEMGKPLYERHGFREVCQVERRIGMAPVGRRPHPDCLPLDHEELLEVLPLDFESFGADRSALLTDLICVSDAVAIVYRPCGAPEGYLLGRPGTGFFHIGPWVAATPEAAEALLDSAFSVLGGERVGIDVLVPNEAAVEICLAAKLKTARTLVRMARGPVDAVLPSAGHGRPPGGRPDRIYGLAGLEWG